MDPYDAKDHVYTQKTIMYVCVYNVYTYKQ